MYRPWPGLIPSARGHQLCSKYPRTYAFHGPYLWLIQHRGLHEHGQMTLYKRRGDIPLVEVGTLFSTPAFMLGRRPISHHDLVRLITKAMCRCFTLVPSNCPLVWDSWDGLGEYLPTGPLLYHP